MRGAALIAFREVDTDDETHSGWANKQSGKREVSPVTQKPLISENLLREIGNVLIRKLRPRLLL